MAILEASTLVACRVHQVLVAMAAVSAASGASVSAAPPPSAPAQRVAVLLRGESFRQGPQYSREVSPGTELQLQATRSQKKFLVEAFQERGLHADVFLATYDTPHLGVLLDAWGEHLTKYRRSQQPGSQEGNAWDAVSLLWTYARKRHTEYRFVVVLRNDMVLKQDLAKLLLERTDVDDKLLVPFRMTKSLRFGVRHRVPDTLQVVPWKLFGRFMAVLEHGSYWPGEGIWGAMMPLLGGEAGHLGLLVDWYGDSDPEKFQNPLYSFAQRQDGPVAPEFRKDAPASFRGLVFKMWLATGLLALLIFGLLLVAFFQGKARLKTATT